MALSTIQQAAFQPSRTLLSAFLKDAKRERSRLNAEGRLCTMLNVDIRTSCRYLSDHAKRLLDDTFHCHDETLWPDRPEADILEAGIVGWHHDHGACFNPQRVLIAFPTTEGFVVDISRLAHDQVDETSIDDLNDKETASIIETSVPLFPGTTFFLDHDIWHRVRFVGDVSKLNGAGATLFYDFALREDIFL